VDFHPSWRASLCSATGAHKAAGHGLRPVVLSTKRKKFTPIRVESHTQGWIGGLYLYPPGAEGTFSRVALSTTLSAEPGIPKTNFCCAGGRARYSINQGAEQLSDGLQVRSEKGCKKHPRPRVNTPATTLRLTAKRPRYCGGVCFT
jgi:hypothetical protein